MNDFEYVLGYIHAAAERAEKRTKMIIYHGTTYLALFGIVSLFIGLHASIVFPVLMAGGILSLMIDQAQCRIPPFIKKMLKERSRGNDLLMAMNMAVEDRDVRCIQSLRLFAESRMAFAHPAREPLRP